jgi:molecular chaperone DnaK
VDITPHSYSTSSVCFATGVPDIECVPIIPRNTPLPASKSEIFDTLYDNQEMVKVDVYQGEGRFPAENTFIGEFAVEGLGKVPAGNLVVIAFDLDLNGMIKVTATEKATGLAKTVEMDTRGRRVLDLEEARRNIASVLSGSGAAPQGHPAEASPSAGAEDGDSAKLVAAAKDLRKRAEALLQKSVPPEDADEIRQLVHQSAKAISESDWRGLHAKNDALSDLLFYLED